ncbi:MAG TPA: septum formation initiator family protein [Rubricoccaceae bacterium]|jgi:cell division protein FtsB
MTRTLRSRLVATGLAALAVWVAFFDSHSLLRRAQYAHELGRISDENAAMAAANAEIEARIARGLDPETVETVAREQYGMRRPGETVYRVLDDGGPDLWSVEPDAPAPAPAD